MCGGFADFLLIYGGLSWDDWVESGLFCVSLVLQQANGNILVAVAEYKKR